MPRYYSICEATPSHRISKRNFLRVYGNAPQGYLFHDTDEYLEVDMLRKPMFILSELYAEAKTVVYVRVDNRTIMATFNTAGIPRPARTGDREFLSKNRLFGWLQKDVRDPASDAILADYDDIYDTCTMLERFTGNCPCPKLEEGTCLTTTMYAAHPWLADQLTSFSEPETTEYKRKRYQDLNGFVFTPGQYSINADFTEAIRPWDNYDFALVAARSKEFSERGAENARRFAHRKIECSQCTFSTKHRDGTYGDCGQVRNCDSHTTEEQAWEALYTWLAATPYENGTSKFALHEIHYLMSIAGEDHLSRAITPTRNGNTKLAGFRLGGDDLTFRVAPCQGNTTRKKKYPSYAELRAEFPALPESDKIPEVHLERKHVLAHAIFSTWGYVHTRDGHQPHPVYSITKMRHETILTGTSTRSTFWCYCLTPASHVMEFFQRLWPHGFATAKIHLNTVMPAGQSADY